MNTRRYNLLLVFVIAAEAIGLAIAACSNPSEPEPSKPPADVEVCQAWPEPKGILCCNMAVESCRFFRE